MGSSFFKACWSGPARRCAKSRNEDVHHRQMFTTEDTENTEILNKEITEAAIGPSICVHTELGPGLLESVYEKCLGYELSKRGHRVQVQKEIPIIHQNISFEVGFQADLVVDGKLLIEVKAIDQLLPVHHAQVIIYLKLTGLRTALLVNFNVPLLRDGLKRVSL
jgi:GxxExxY protein